MVHQSKHDNPAISGLKKMGDMIESNMMPSMTESSLKVGDRVKVRAGAEHNSMTKDKTGTIKEIGTPALGIVFDGMSDVHRWYTEAELDSE